MAAVQMNIRMDSTLKEAGNAAIAELGLTPSQVVRALWEYVAVQGNLPPMLGRAFKTHANGENSENDRHLSHVDGGAAIVSTFYETIGIDEPLRESIDYDELRELAAAEQLEKWGLE